MTREPLVPADFRVPRELRAARFRLAPLGPEHNASDLAAWTSSIAHVRATRGFAGRDWPPEAGFTAEQNLVDLVRHADEFERRVAFAYTVLPPGGGDVIGCLYLDPGPRPGSVDVRSWVRADVPDLDGILRAEVRDWLARAWPFDEVLYADQRTTQAQSTSRSNPRGSPTPRKMPLAGVARASASAASTTAAPVHVERSSGQRLPSAKTSPVQ